MTRGAYAVAAKGDPPPIDGFWAIFFSLTSKPSSLHQRFAVVSRRARAILDSEDRAQKNAEETKNDLALRLVLGAAPRGRVLPVHVRRGVPEISADTSLDTSIARRHAIAAASSRCLIRGDSAQDWELEPESTCIHGGWAPDPATTARAVPVYRTGPYQFESTEKAAKLFALAELGNIYSRIMNPTTDVLEKRMALLEGAPELGGLGVASGTNAAFYSIINLAKAGDNIVSARNLYGGTYTQFKDILPTLGITVKFVDAEDPENFRAAIDDKTRALFCETVSNPALEICDLEAISAIGHEKNIPLIVDSTFSTPYLTKP